MNALVVYSSTMRTLECRPGGASAPYYSLQTASRLTGVHPDLVDYYCRLGLVEGIIEQPSAERIFEPSALEEIRRLEHYRRNLGVQRRALFLLCELWREAEHQGLRLNFLRIPESFRPQPESAAGNRPRPAAPQSLRNTVFPLL